MVKLLTSSVILASLLLGCSVHKLEVQQGNVLTPEMIGGLRTGIDKRQVRFVLGTPTLTDPFHQDRWDYVYLLKEYGKPTVQKRLTLRFEGEQLVAIEPVGIGSGAKAAR